MRESEHESTTKRSPREMLMSLGETPEEVIARLEELGIHPETVRASGFAVKDGMDLELFEELGSSNEPWGAGGSRDRVLPGPRFHYCSKGFGQEVMYNGEWHTVISNSMPKGSEVAQEVVIVPTAALEQLPSQPE